jgi:hypothetical protein
MIAGQYRYEWLGEERLYDEFVGRVAVAEEACVEGVFRQGLNQA